MATKVTLQDIADALGVSRNTVSKAINNTGVLAESTRQKVLEKAIEMGYKQFSYASDLSDNFIAMTDLLFAGTDFKIKIVKLED